MHGHQFELNHLYLVQFLLQQLQQVKGTAQVLLLHQDERRRKVKQNRLLRVKKFYLKRKAVFLLF